MKTQQQVFIVDDDESVCRSLNLFLSTYGFSVKTFTRAEEFFLAVPNNVSGCLILDIHMPGMDGWKALKLLEESGSRRPVIIITVDKNGWLNDKVLKAGVVGFLQKPFSGQKLIDLINDTFSD